MQIFNSKMIIILIVANLRHASTLTAYVVVLVSIIVSGLTEWQYRHKRMYNVVNVKNQDLIEPSSIEEIG